MSYIQATKETGPLHYAAIAKGAVAAAGLTNPGEITVSGVELISDAKESELVKKVAASLKITQAEAEGLLAEKLILTLTGSGGRIRKGESEV